jgi:hypothetical protein
MKDLAVYRRFLSFFILVCLLVLSVPIVKAHGGGTPQLTNTEVGPYWISVWTQPDPPQVGELHLTAALAKPGTINASLKEAGPPILNALIEVQLRPWDRPGEIISVVASHENAANKLFYEADLDVPHSGRWEATLLVSGPDGGSGRVSFELEVVEGSTINMSWLLIGVMAIFLAAAVWMMRGAFRPNPPASSQVS